MSDSDATRVESCEVCIVGTGAAGGILAYRLAQAGLNVLSLEQGGPISDDYFTNELNPEEEPHFGITSDMPWDLDPGQGFFFGNARANALYAPDDQKSTSAASHDRFVNLQIFRANGKLNLWNAVTLRQSRRDFLGKDFGDSHHNWPIGYDDLAPHYGAVEKLIGVCGTHEGLEQVPDADEYLPPLPLRPADRILLKTLPGIRDVPIRAIPMRKAIETRVDQENRCRNCGDCYFGCRTGAVYKFTSRLLPRIEKRDNYRIVYNVKVRRLLRDPQSNRIQAADCLDTTTGKPIRVEARTFILAAGALETPRILFNSRDEAFPDGLANRSGLVGCYLQDKVKAVLGTSLVRLMGSRRRYEFGSDDALIIPRFLFDNREFRGGFMYSFCHFLPKRPYYLDAFQMFPARLKPHLARFLFRSYAALMCFGKAEAQRSNRLTSSRDCDVYGIPQVDVHYNFSENDRKMQRSMIAYGRRILRRCSGLIIMEYADPLPGRSIHYAGTCRMAAEANEGVVDANLRTFDHPNLYLCDGSVVPELAEKNITLTIMALAERLARHFTSVDEQNSSTHSSASISPN